MRFGSAPLYFMHDFLIVRAVVSRDASSHGVGFGSRESAIVHHRRALFVFFAGSIALIVVAIGAAVPVPVPNTSTGGP